MFWHRRNRRRDNEKMGRLAAGTINSSLTKAELLEAAPDNLVRMRMCAEWQAKARAAWYEGERREVIKLLTSEQAQHRHMDVRARKLVGQRMWALNPKNKDLAGAEQMYARWVSSYSALAKADGLIP